MIGVNLLSYNGKVIYTVISDHFDKVPYGEIISFYDWELTTVDNKTLVSGCIKRDTTVEGFF